MGEAKRRGAARRATDPNMVQAAVKELSKRLTDEGWLIEAGFASMRAMAIPADAPAIQLEEMRLAFFCGAQHLFGSIMTILDPAQEEPTEADMRRMDQIKAELDRFIEEYAARNLPAGRA